ncbi:MAG: diaminopimelate epimerase, partial [Actinobacteria bacterium]|nr:diaminopimelate epimerase [Actinomycetota bacterium]
MDFVKYHGLGNDFLVLNDLNGERDLAPEVIAALCARGKGVGADGLILARKPVTSADVAMGFYNADGSTAQMCGNGIRCLAKFVHDEGLIAADPMFIETGAGVREVRLVFEDGAVVGAEVDMGLPELVRERIPMRGEGDPLDEEIPLGEGTARVTCLSMGNPHCVLFVEDVDRAAVAAIGADLEVHDMFPERTNVEFAEVQDANHMRLRVWERGVGETLACGTGACAAFVAAQR